VPQRETFDTLFPLTGREVATMGRYPRIGVGRRARRGDRDFVADILRLMGVDEVADQPFRDLSGGQKQRVLISRALAGEPDALILDEPTASMDVRGEREVMDLLDTLRSDRGITIIMVSHFLSNLRGHVDRVLICDRDGDGFAEGDPDSVLSAEGIAHLFSGSPRHGERD
jgi:ABC-type Mn2+/Zn2+ transport system ATPase subunit